MCIRDSYQADDKQPAMLDFEGAGSFTELVRKYSGDMTPRAVLDELMRVGVAAVEPDSGRLQLKQRAYVPAGDSEDMLQIFGEDVSDLVATIDHNLISRSAGKPPLFQRTLTYDNIPADVIERWREISAERSQADTPQSIIRCRLGGHDGSHVDLPALHVFFDATILTRLNGLLDAVAHDGRSSSERTIPTQQPVSRNRAAPPQAPQDDRRPVGITCPLLRVEARCPAPRHLRDAVGDDDLLRGGRVVLDLSLIHI